ncbi:MAG: ABC transporter substrate-binding protein [Balneolaceae bacterium]|nr:ABC transporter substrate-binding protein [Balneolaceae bacterium]
MKTFLISLFLFTTIQAQAFAQSFTRAMEHYRAEEYAEAAELFVESEDDRAQLFAGKSFLNLADYSKAIRYLKTASESMRENIRQEALYSLALAHFGLQNYDVSLQHLYDLAASDNRTGLRSDAQRFYSQILNYLSINDRYQTLYRLNSPAIQYDLVNSSKSFLNENTYRILVDELVRLTGDRFSEQQIERELLSNLSSQTALDQYPAAPEGMVYNIGVILPTFHESDPDFTIPRNLYYGMVLAADDFNDRNSNKKVNLIFRNSAENTDTTAVAFSELAWTKKVDAVIGPLFSEPASRMAQLAEEFRIPMLAPLANSDSLNLDYNYTYQMNPTFEIHGKKMAQFAVRELNLNSFTIITEEGALGRASALAFRHEAERLGASISYYIEEDFESTGYDFSQITEIFTTDAVLADSLNITPSDAVYAPFTGEASTTMMNLLMNNIEAMGSDIVVLGSEEWEYASLTDYQRRNFDIYYTQPYVENPDTSSTDAFRDDYQTRFSSEPDRFSRIGYDTANYLLRSLETAGNPDYLGHAMRNRPLHRGLAFHVFFDGQRINQHVFIRSLSLPGSGDQNY